MINRTGWGRGGGMNWGATRSKKYSLVIRKTQAAELVVFNKSNMAAIATLCIFNYGLFYYGKIIRCSYPITLHRINSRILCIRGCT